MAKMESRGYRPMDGIEELRQQHEKFAEEIILRLKYYYRLYEEKPYPKSFQYVTLEICDAVFAISFVFRCHYRQVYYALHDELIDSEEYEKYCFSLPVQRGKRFTFNFLFRISLMFELSMYLFKEGYDYFDIARKCLAAYPDLLYFDASGSWTRLSEIGTYIINVTKVWEVDIAVEHPLLGTFIETDQYIHPDEEVFDVKQLLQESIEIDKMIESGVTPNYDKDFFNPRDMQTIKVLYKHFVAPRTPKSKCKPKDLLKIGETFPLSDRVPFEVEDFSNTHYFIVYDIYVEKKEILYYFRSYMDPAILEKYFPLKTSPDSPDEEIYEENLHNIPEYFQSDFSHENSEEEGNKAKPRKDPYEFDSEKFQKCLEHRCNHLDNLDDISDFHASDFSDSEEESSKSDSSKGSSPDKPDDMKIYKNAESSGEAVVSPEKINTNVENSEVEAAHCADSSNQCAKTLKKEVSIPPWLSIKVESPSVIRMHSGPEPPPVPLSESISSILELPKEEQLAVIKLIIDISRLPKDKKEMLINSLPNVFDCRAVKLPFIKNVLSCVRHSTYSESAELSDSLRNITYVSPDTKYLLFKIIMNCAELLVEERNELFRILFRIPDNPVAQKASLIRLVSNMYGCGKQVRSELSQCIINLTDEECNMLSRSAASINIAENFEGIFQNEDELRSEYERCMELYCIDAQIDLDVCTMELEMFNTDDLPVVQKPKSRKAAKENVAAKPFNAKEVLALRPRAVPKKMCQDSNKSSAEVKEQLMPTCSAKFSSEKTCVIGEIREVPQKDYKCFEGSKVESKTPVASASVSLEEKYSPKLEASHSHLPSNRRHCKAAKKSRKRSKK